MRNSPSRGPQPMVPSPLQNVHLAAQVEKEAPLAIGLVQDPNFWKRFSTAVHLAEYEQESKEGLRQSMSSFDGKYGNQWLDQQRKEKRRYEYMCLMMLLALALIITLAAVLGWYFTKGRK